MSKEAIRKLCDPIEAAKFLGVPRGTLSSWRVNGSGPPYIKMNRLVRYAEQDLVRWLARNRVEPEPQKSEEE